MASVSEFIDVDVPARFAFERWADLEQLPQFVRHIESIDQRSARTSVWHVRLGEADREFTAEVTAVRPGSLMRWRTVDGDVDHEGTIAFTGLSAVSARVGVQIEWRPSGVAESAGALLSLDSSAVRHALAGFRQHVEDEYDRTVLRRSASVGAQRR